MIETMKLTRSPPGRSVPQYRIKTNNTLVCASAFNKDKQKTTLPPSTPIDKYVVKNCGSYFAV